MPARQSCDLCNSKIQEQDKPCPVCGAEDAKWLYIISLGYIYPYEAQMTRKFLNLVLLIFFLSWAVIAGIANLFAL